MIDGYVLVDANDPKIAWDAISMGIVYWKITIGDICPEFCDQTELVEGDVGLLLDQAKLLVSDREEYRILAAEKHVPFIVVRPEDNISGVLEKMNGDWYTKQFTHDHNSYI